MWMTFGVGAIIFAAINIFSKSKNNNSKIYGFLSLSLTALTIFAFYADGATRLVNRDWYGLMDIMLTMSKALWICTLASIFLNSIPLFRKE